MNNRFANWFILISGVRALLIDKDQKPQWKPARLEDCTAEQIDAYFQPIENELRFWKKKRST